MQEYFDEPFDPTAPIPFLEVARLARQNGTVVALGGDGADELFAGYLRYDDFDRPDWIPPGHPTALCAGSARAACSARWPPATWRAISATKAASMRTVRAVLDERLLGQLEEGHEAAMRRFHRPDLPAVTAAQYLDANLFMVDQVLCKVDRASMAHGVEVRVPFLDPELVGARLPDPAGAALPARRAQGAAQADRRAVPARRSRHAAQEGLQQPAGKMVRCRPRPLAAQLDGRRPAGAARPVAARLARRLASVPALQGAAGKRARWLILTAELWARRWVAGERLAGAEATT